jgi:hypothetical protein
MSTVNALISYDAKNNEGVLRCVSTREAGVLFVFLAMLPVGSKDNDVKFFSLK